MNLNNAIQEKIENHLQEKLIATSSVGGGCISDAMQLKTKGGNNYFLKINTSFEGLFNKEANGLKEMKKAGAITVPEVLLVGNNFLLLEWMEQGSKTNDFFEVFGRQFAQMHRYKADSFGFFEDNFIGSTPQINVTTNNTKTNWIEFYWNKRLLFQYQLAERNGWTDKRLKKGFFRLESKLDSILDGSDEPPTLLHGDLWSGNYMVAANGLPVLIDPAVYYGHREADLAMTKLFGGFSDQFYEAYKETYPLPDGWEYRENIYKLYHIFNHLNLFGSGYYGQTVRLIEEYL